MVLIKCKNCGSMISDKSKQCPKCVYISDITIGKKANGWKSRHVIYSLLVWIFFTLIVIIGSIFFSYLLEYKSNFKKNDKNQIALNEILSSTMKDTQLTKQLYKLQQINNVGYQFYLGEIETNDQTNISEGLINQITQIIYTGHFPKSLLNNLAIIIVNTLVVTPNSYINTPSGDIKVINFEPDFISGGGIYSQRTGVFSIIYINKNKITLSSEAAIVAAALGNKGGVIDVMALKSVLPHELGHHLGNSLTYDEWDKYYILRNIPSSTPLRSNNWEQSPSEDFAEVYANIYFGTRVKTIYGTLPTPTKTKNEYDEMMQQILGSYKRASGQLSEKIVDDATKKFMLDVINRINKQ